MTATDSDVTESLSKDKQANRPTKAPDPPLCPFICSNESDEFNQGIGPLTDLRLDQVSLSTWG